MAARWKRIETAPNGKAVLVQHRDDLYPVVALQMPGETLWVYETDGPEDVVEPGSHRFKPLPRKPTHWMDLPDSPLVYAEDLKAHYLQAGFYWPAPDQETAE